jgi:dCTP deaminase
MILSGLEICSKIGKEIIIDPFDRTKVNPNSYNLSLHHALITYSHFPLDMKKENPYQEIAIPPGGLVLEPNRL